MDFLFSKISELTAFITKRSDLIILLGSLSLVTFFGTILLLPFLLINIPQDYFMESYVPSSKSRKTRFSFHILKNFLGVIFLLMGIIMLFIPGQGVLTIVAGLWLMDLPGKKRLEKWTLSNKSIFTAINKIRQKAGKAPLELPEKNNVGDKDHSSK